MLVLGGKAKNEEEARDILKGHLEDGTALAKLRELGQAQHGDVGQIDHPETPAIAKRPLLIYAIVTRDGVHRF